nr:bifunctional DNA primase/polymerase [Chloroflexota bacterium]
MSALRAAERYVSRGFAVVPIPLGKKSPVLEGWEGLRLSSEELPQHFNGKPQNVGILLGNPSGGLVDVDLDTKESGKVAGRFLPPTLTSGRESSPHSHWWYVSPGAKTIRYKDVNGEVLVEVRSSGCQTIVAPSIHPSGERVVWHHTGPEFTEVGAQELLGRVRELATTTLIARYVSPAGGRHAFALALAGFLLRPGRLDEEMVLKLLRAAWYAAGADSKEALRDLEGIVRDTAENLAKDSPVVGGPTLEEYVPGMVRLLCKWWGWNRHEAPENTPEEKEDRRNQADRLIGYALKDVQGLFVDQHGAPHALVGGEPLPLNSRCYSWLRRLMWHHEERAVSGEYLKTAAGTLAAHAEFSGEIRELHTRAAWHEDTLYYELRPGRVVGVGSDVWDFGSNPPVLFRRYPNLKLLPDPRPGGDVKALASYANLKTKRDKRLFIAYAVTAALPHVGRPILNASGAMGSGKTTIGRLLKRLLDPTAPETVRLDPRDFLQKASHAYFVMLDNQNTVPEWAADTLC